MCDIFSVRDDGCYRGSSAGHGICDYAHVSLPDRSMSVQSGLDIYCFSKLPYPGMSVYFLSYQLGIDFSGSFGVLFDSIPKITKKILKHMFGYAILKAKDRIRDEGRL